MPFFTTMYCPRRQALASGCLEVKVYGLVLWIYGLGLEDPGIGLEKLRAALTTLKFE